MVLGKDSDKSAYREATPVSILVLMDGAREGASYNSMNSLQLVSILVLMDGAREAETRPTIRASSRGFNPCFDGWCSGSFLLLFQCPASSRFQSLF